MQAEMRRACSYISPAPGPMAVSIAFCFRRPQSWPKAQRDAVDNGQEPWYTGKPDLDNLIKLVKDAGNGILWVDDSQIVQLEATKVYTAESETIINVFTLSTHPIFLWAT